MATKKAALYPIRAASRLTRLSPDTLRAWERRHQAVQPARKNGLRLYTPADVERLSLLRDALATGYSIGQAAPLSDQELQALRVKTPSEPRLARGREALSAPPRAVVEAIESFAYLAADRELSRLGRVMSSRELVHEAALPLMRWAGQRWHEQRLRPSQEHMLTQLLGNLLGGLMRVHTAETPPAYVLTATLSGDHHAFGTLAAAMLASSAGLGVVPLGASVPPEEIAYAAKRSGSHVVLVSITGTGDSETRMTQLEALARRLPRDIELWVGLNPPEMAPAYKLKRRRFLILTDFASLEGELKRIGGRF